MNENDIYPKLDPKQMDLLNRKMQNFDGDAVIGESLPNEATMPPPPDVIMQPPIRTQEASIDDTKRKIMELEQELGDAPKYDTTAGEMTFRDSAGNETYYVKNVAGRHVVISDILDMAKIPVGKAVDLLKLASIEDIKKSRDLRNAMYGLGPEKCLQRLTEREYLNEKLAERDQQKRVNIMRQQEELYRMQNQKNPANQMMPHERPFNSPLGNEKTVRPVVLAKLGKLALRNDPDPEVSRQAMTPPEFVTWVQGERLSHYEIEYIMGNPDVVREHDIRAALLEKRKSIPPE